VPEPATHIAGAHAFEGGRVRGGRREASDAALDGVAQCFQPLSAVPLSRDDAREITENLGRFFDVLERWAVEDAQRGVGPLAERFRDLGLTTPAAPFEVPQDQAQLDAAGTGRRRRGGGR
jgi:hypothetical protein